MYHASGTLILKSGWTKSVDTALMDYSIRRYFKQQPDKKYTFECHELKQAFSEWKQCIKLL